MQNIIHDICTGLLDLIYPPFCLVCNTAGEDYLCAKCIESIDIIGPVHCHTCGMPTEKFKCSDCQVREYSFESAASAGVFDGTLREAIHQLKYNSRTALADPLAEIMVRSFPDTRLAGRIDIVVPIPIHRSRHLERGFNQAEELASRFCRRLRLTLSTNALVKTKKTQHQVDLPQDLRYTNVQGVFRVNNPASIAGKRVLLIDDVITTGSTLSEAAKALTGAGATSVCAYTLARSI
ncbi:MAG: ComF family protein [Armatimonadetes bacterium]|nr:ComF family protein [Armatimonadota bacterium]